MFGKPESGFEQKFASRELARGLRSLGLAGEPVETAQGIATLASGDFVFSLSVDKGPFKNPEAYQITHEATQRVSLTGASPQAVLHQNAVMNAIRQPDVSEIAD